MRSRSFLKSVKKLFDRKGFRVPLGVFICSISISDIIETFLVLEKVIKRGASLTS
jgi:hypothetical protein